MAGIEFSTWEILCNCFIFVMGVLGNLTVIIVVLKSGSANHRFRDVPFNVYLTALAIVDLACAVTCLPIYVLSSSVFDHPTGFDGDVMCKLVSGYLIPFWFSDTSIFTLVIISFERHAAICKPFQSLHLGIPRRTYLYVALTYLVAFILQIPTIVGTRWAGVNGTVSYCTYDWPSDAVSISIYAVVLVAHYIVPAAIFSFNFYRIKKCLTRLDKNLQQTIGNAKHRIKIMKTKKKTIHIVFMVTIAFFVLWSPNLIMYFLFQFGKIHGLEWNSKYYQAGIVLGLSSSWLNPILYAFQSKDFRSHCRKVFMKVFGKLFIRQPQVSSSQPSCSSSSIVKTKIKFKKLQTPVECSSVQ